MSEYSVGEVRARFEAMCAAKGWDISDDRDEDTAWIAYQAAYADLREQIERAREGVSDDDIESLAKKAGARWDGSRWVFEDADLHPFVRSLLAVAHLLPSERGGVEGAVPRAWISHRHIVGIPDKDFYGELPIQSMQPGVYSHTALFDKPPPRPPIIVPPYVSANDANRLYGEQFGVDWKYEAITADTFQKLHPLAQAAQDLQLEPNGGNYYRPHKAMVNSGTFWRCAHGHTAFAGPCPHCVDESAQACHTEPVAQGEAVLDRAVLAYRMGCTGSVEGHNHRAGLAAVIASVAAQPRAVLDGCEAIKSDALPPGYTLGHSKSDGGYWPILNRSYIGTDWYRTQAEAEAAAWKHAHEKLAGIVDSIRRTVRAAAAPSPGEPQS